jgi:hypothetical protein
MPVQTTTTGTAGFPNPSTIVEHVERGARAGMADAGALLESGIRGRTPTRTGAAAGAVHARVSRTASGLQLRVAPDNKLHPSSDRSTSRKLPNSIIWRFLEKGTGNYGPLRRRIPLSKRGLVGAGGAVRRPSGHGFAGRHIFTKAADELDGPVITILDAAVEGSMRSAT